VVTGPCRLTLQRKVGGMMHRSRSQIAEELTACIRCNECLAVCPALPLRIPIETLNRETLGEYISPEISQFAGACCQCGACVPVCPVGLHRDAMMLWLKMRLLREDLGHSSDGIPGWSVPPVQISVHLPATGESRRNDSAWPTKGSEGCPDDNTGRMMPWR
jgi:ferredoxin